MVRDEKKRNSKKKKTGNLLHLNSENNKSRELRDLSIAHGAEIIFLVKKVKVKEVPGCTWNSQKVPITSFNPHDLNIRSHPPVPTPNLVHGRNIFSQTPNIIHGIHAPFTQTPNEFYNPFAQTPATHNHHPIPSAPNLIHSHHHGQNYFTSSQTPSMIHGQNPFVQTPSPVRGQNYFGQSLGVHGQNPFVQSPSPIYSQNYFTSSSNPTHGKNPFRQSPEVWFKCVTCWGVESSMGFCAACLDCHKGHQVLSFTPSPLLSLLHSFHPLHFPHLPSQVEAHQGTPFTSFTCHCGSYGHNPSTCSNVAAQHSHEPLTQPLYRCYTCFHSGTLANKPTN